MTLAAKVEVFFPLWLVFSFRSFLIHQPRLLVTGGCFSSPTSLGDEMQGLLPDQVHGVTKEQPPVRTVGLF